MRKTIENYKTKEQCFLVSVDESYQFSEKNIERLVSVCNQPLIYDFLFRSKLEGKPYSVSDARSFLDWCAKGWLEQTHFVFLIMNSEDEIIGAVDIKSNNREQAEIGYWADVNHPGVMTNAVKMLITLARSAGYLKLFATTKLENHRSQQVLVRSGFEKQGEILNADGEPRVFFEIVLT